jgi:RNA-directed DNA polymerase
VDSSTSKSKPFVISKELVWEAYQKVRANKGAAGVDGVTVEDFEKDLRNSLYRIWNRMSSGTYFPPAGESGGNTEAGRWGGVRVLGVPTRR